MEKKEIMYVFHPSLHEPSRKPADEWLKRGGYMSLNTAGCHPDGWRALPPEDDLVICSSMY